MIELIAFSVCSVIIARRLEKTRYRMAVVFHAILFGVLLFVYAFASDVPFLAMAAKGWVGEDTYETAHEILRSSMAGIQLGVSAFFFVENAFLLMMILGLAIVALRGYRFLVRKAKLIRSAPVLFERLYPASSANPCAASVNVTRPTYLVLGQLRN